TRAAADAPQRGRTGHAGLVRIRADGDLHAVTVQTPHAGGGIDAVEHARDMRPHGAVGVGVRHLGRLGEDVAGTGILARGVLGVIGATGILTDAQEYFRRGRRTVTVDEGPV